MRKPFNYPCPPLSLSIWLGVEKARRQTESHLDTVAIEDLKGVRDRVVDDDKVPNVGKDIGSSAGAQDFPDQSSTPCHNPKRFILLRSRENDTTESKRC